MIILLCNVLGFWWNVKIQRYLMTLKVSHLVVMENQEIIFRIYSRLELLSFDQPDENWTFQIFYLSAFWNWKKKRWELFYKISFRIIISTSKGRALGQCSTKDWAEWLYSTQRVRRTKECLFKCYGRIGQLAAKSCHALAWLIWMMAAYVPSDL